jgi:hypothetical protein
MASKLAIGRLPFDSVRAKGGTMLRFGDVDAQAHPRVRAQHQTNGLYPPAALSNQLGMVTDDDASSTVEERASLGHL